MMWPSKTLVAVVFMLQVAQSPSCTITNICRLGYNNDKDDSLYQFPTNSLHDCLKTCYSIENCTYALLQQGSCWTFAEIKFDVAGWDTLDCNYYRLERNSTARLKQCQRVSDLL